jgi:hypothetical protein
MKKPVNIWELLFLLAFIMKGTNTKFFGAVPSLFVVVLPLIISEGLFVLASIEKINNWRDKIRYRLWKFRFDPTARKIIKQAEKDMRTGNPGQFVDASKTGKK